MDDDDATRTRRATIEDVAAAAEVSVATVSRALRDLPNVAPSTRERVRQAAVSLDYAAHPAAARLATGRSRAIGVLVPFVNSWYCAEVMAGVEAICAEAGYDTIVIAVGTGADGRRRIDGSLRLHRKVDAIVSVDLALDPDEVAELHASGLGIASIGTDHAGHPSTGVDDRAVGRLATEHLLRLGHRRIGIIGDRTNSVYAFVVPEQRRQGHEDALRAAGIEPDPELFADGSFTIEGGADGFDQLMRSHEPPTAIFALDDAMASGALRRARELGIAIPDEVSIIGVDDQPIADVLGLTTVRQDVAEHGARAARVLIDQLAGLTVDAGRVDAPVTLVERRTTAQPPAAARSESSTPLAPKRNVSGAR